ncbi:MAG: DEAD/DEAH box helicase family protein [Solobacterium sp.]|nr:DEAD/DEAH box helicase family protein [Solobacterium sp.]
MRCPRCLNADQEFFYHGSKGWYCRKCISFGRALLEEDREPAQLSPIHEGSEEYSIPYPLTADQKRISHQCAEAIDEKDVLLYCVCGAGKTELVTESISKMLRQGKKVGFAIPRRQVVLELRERLAGYFPYAKVIAVCGGHTEETDGDLIICTTHQTYRYYQAFDLLILDEPDAFPFRGNAVLHGIAKTSCQGRMIYLTATPDAILRKRVEQGTLACLRLNRRAHGHDLPVPVLETGSLPVLLIKLVRWLHQHDSPRMVFVPTIHEADLLQRFLSLFMPCMKVTSKSPDRDEIIEKFRNQKDGIIVTTTVMERGVTIPGVDVCVFHADHEVFDVASLIQMAGRVGRTFDHPDGDVLFLLEEKSHTADRCRDELMEANRCAA